MNSKKLLSLILMFCLLLMPIQSFADDITETNSLYEELDIESSSDSSNIPSINARHSVIIDRKTNLVLFGKNENEKCKMASTTKIMTAIIVLENCTDLNQVITISKKAAGTGGSRLGLSKDDKISIINLLYGLLMVSGNDAAVALSEFISGDINSFSDLMNKKAIDLGLNSTHFTSPHGLDQEDHFTTAYELALITNYALKNKVFSQIVNTKTYTIFINENSKTLNNTNELLGYLDGIYGVKTGFTNGANRCLVTSCKRGDLDIICVVLGCDTKKNRTLDSIKLINYVFNNFSIFNIKEFIFKSFSEWKTQDKNIFYINKGEDIPLDLYIDESKIPYDTIAINNQKIDTISTTYCINNFYEAPLNKDTVIGKIELKAENDTLFSVNILNANTIKKHTIFYYFYVFFKDYISYVTDI